jgi:hypothetical protein
MVSNRKSGSKGGRIVAIVTAIIIIGIMVAAIFYFAGRSQNPYTGGGGYASTTQPVPQVHTATLLSQGNVYSINPGSSDTVNFTIPSGAYSISVAGSYTSQGKIEVAILTPTEYGAFTQSTSSIQSSQYYYGDTQGSTINAQLSPGQYTLVFYDPGIITQDTVTVVNPITLTYTTPS